MTGSRSSRRLGRLARLGQDDGEVADVADEAGVGGRGTRIAPGLERGLEDVDGLLSLGGRAGGVVAAVEGAVPWPSAAPARGDCASSHRLDFCLIPASASIDGSYWPRRRQIEAQVEPGVVPLHAVGPGGGRVPRQVQDPLEVADAVDLGEGVVSFEHRLHADQGRLRRRAGTRIAPGQVFGEDVGLVILLVGVVAEGQVVASQVELVDLRGRVGLAGGGLEQQDRAFPVASGHGLLGPLHRVLVGQPGDLLGLHGGPGLVLAQQGQGLVLERRGEPDDLAQGVDNLLGGGGTIIVGKPGHLRVDGLGQLELHAQAFPRPHLFATAVGAQPFVGLVGGQRVLLALGQGDDVEVADVPLEATELGILVVQELLVESDRRSDLALLLEALRLPHLGGRGPPIAAGGRFAGSRIA